MRSKVFFIINLVCVSYVGLVANEVSVNLGKSIVSASRVDTPVNEAPGNVSVVTQKEIDLRPNYKFSDTLRGFEGLQQSKSRGMDTFDGVKIRGLSGAAVMVDGIMLNDINNNTKMLTAMNAEDIMQVEVVRGAFPIFMAVVRLLERLILLQVCLLLLRQGRVLAMAVHWEVILPQRIHFVGM